MNTLIRTIRPFAGAAVSAALVVSAPALLLAPAPLAAQAQTSDLAQAVAALRAISTLQADFAQSDRTGRTVRGVLTLKRPGKIRFQYEKGISILIVSDGSALSFIDYQVRQVQRWPIRNSPLGALLDPSKDVMRYARQVPTGNPAQVAVEVRDKGHPEYGTITMIFGRNGKAPGGLELQGWTTLDAQNVRTTVSLANHRYGLAVSDNTFRFNDPRGSTHR
jgi:outer membrane lipoprotein-sorting protein